jgi:hypothetical protein
MKMKYVLVEYVAPAAVVSSLVSALLWSVVDFAQGGL